MARFQAQTNAVLDRELEVLRSRLGLRENQKAELLREMAALASWLVRQAEAGRTIVARRGTESEELSTPILDRLREEHADELFTRIELTDGEVERLAEILDRGFSPTPGLREALSALSAPDRQPPALRWKGTEAA